MCRILVMSYFDKQTTNMPECAAFGCLNNSGKELERQQPITFASIGAAIGVLIVLADQYLAYKPSIPHWIFQILLIIVLAAVGFASSKVYRYMVSIQQSSLLDPPPDILGDMNGSTPQSSEQSEEKEIPRTQHHGPTAGRQRYRKGKH